MVRKVCRKSTGSNCDCARQSFMTLFLDYLWLHTKPTFFFNHTKRLEVIVEIFCLSERRKLLLSMPSLPQSFVHNFVLSLLWLSMVDLLDSCYSGHNKGSKDVSVADLALSECSSLRLTCPLIDCGDLSVWRYPFLWRLLRKTEFDSTLLQNSHLWRRNDQVSDTNSNSIIHVSTSKTYCQNGSSSIQSRQCYFPLIFVKSHSQDIRIRRSRINFKVMQRSREEFSMIVIEIDGNFLNWVGVERKITLVVCDEDACNISDLNFNIFWEISFTRELDCVVAKFLWCFNAVFLRIYLDEVFFALDCVLSAEGIWCQRRNPKSFSLLIWSSNHMRQQQVHFFDDFDVSLSFSNDLVW